MIYRVNILQIVRVPKAICRFHEIPLIPITFITGFFKFLKFISKHNDPNILSKKNNSGASTVTDFKIHYRVIVTNPAWCWHKNTTDMFTKRVECKTQKSTHVAKSHLILHKVAENGLEWRLFLWQMVLGKLDILMCTNKYQVPASVPEQKLIQNGLKISNQSLTLNLWNGKRNGGQTPWLSESDSYAWGVNVGN